MDQVKMYNEAMFHPSFFQSRSGRLEQNDPSDQWVKSLHTASNFTVPLAKSGEPRYSRNDVIKMIHALKPMKQRADNNTMPSLLFIGFFSQENVKHLHILIIQTVKKWSGATVGKQDDTTLLQLMNTIYERYAHHIDEFQASKNYVNEYISKEITRLNSLVVDDAVPIIINGVEQHKKYLEHMYTPRTLEQPKFASITGTKLYRTFEDLMYVSPEQHQENLKRANLA